MASLVYAGKLYPVKEQFISEEDLIETECLLRNLRDSQSKAVSHYEAWMEQRKKSIEAIGCLEKKLENLHRECNVVHGVGAAMEVASGLSMIAGTILSACGQKNVGEFLTKKVSPAVGVTGLATALSSSLVETKLTHKTLEEVKMVLERDEAYSKMIVGNFENFNKIDSHMKRIFDCSILSNNFLSVVQLVQEGISLVEVGYEAYSQLKNELKCKALKCTEIAECTETVIQNICTMMKKISQSPKVRKSLRDICYIIQQSPLAIESIKTGLRISSLICDILKLDIFTSLLGFGVLKSSAGVMATKCLLGTIIIAINALSVISAQKDAQEGVSKYSQMLRDLKLALSKELNTVRDNYSKLL